MHVVITGGLGFIGSRIGSSLLKEGHRVSLLDNSATSVVAGLPGAELHKVNLMDPASSGGLKIDKADCMMHLAGPSSGMASAKDPVGTISAGYQITFNALELASRIGVTRFLHASSMVVYGSVAHNPVREDLPCAPISPYGIGKFANERLVDTYCSARDMGFVNFRMFNVYGPGQNLARTDQGLVSIFTAQLLKSPKIVSKGSLERFRDIVHIDDVALAWTLCATRGGARGPLNLGCGESITFRELIQTVADELGIKGKLEIQQAEGTPGDQFGICADISALRAATGFSPKMRPQDGVRDFARWAKQSTAALSR